ncbi:tail assembly chaperone [Arthrobacter phage Kitkat]|uniref:Tail assembly chaperone n=1 Tax=Arthrobacter phage Kitkat TaxID=1796996 RepID=A0A140G6L0_9CAUD|nr:tail assembly chaperone [Arthrobacter phage Kitkat]AMM44295.1 tail assembly chaperone [Arthrobacter phage Kitkat]
MTAETVKPVDLEAILPTLAEYEIDGIPVEIQRLKLRGFLALMNIITTGVGRELGNVDFSADQEELQGNMIALLIMAVPNATDETIRFVRTVVSPKDQKHQKQLNAALEDPELDDFMDILSLVIEQEAPEFSALLGKRQTAPSEAAEPVPEVTDWQLRPWARTLDLISSEYGWTDGQILDELSLARVRQIRDVIHVRRQEILERDLMYKEIEVRAITGAIHSAAGNKRGAAAAQKFSFHKKKAVATEDKLVSMFGGINEADMFTDDMIQAEIARQMAARA